jgi:putative heme-binding domain-containing protein
LLNLVKAKKLPKDMLVVAAEALSTAYRKDIKNEALKYFQVAAPGGKSLPPISELARLKGNAGLGQQVYKTSCSTCHKIDNDGVSFGPALSKIGSKLTRDALLMSIIHPDAGISFGYEGYIFKLKDGNVNAGIVSSETADAVELLEVGGIKRKIQKSTIASRQEMENSLMPAGLHQSMTQQQLVDLVEYLYNKK